MDERWPAFADDWMTYEPKGDDGGYMYVIYDGKRAGSVVFSPKTGQYKAWFYMGESAQPGTGYSVFEAMMDSMIETQHSKRDVWDEQQAKSKPGYGLYKAIQEKIDLEIDKCDGFLDKLRRDEFNLRRVRSKSAF